MKVGFHAYSWLTVVLLVMALPCHASEYLEGMIEPYAKVEFKTQVQGVLDEVLVERGDVIRKGQPLARLKSGVEEALVEQARAMLEFTRRKDERNQELSNKNLISRHEKDEIETEIKKLEMQLREAQERLKLRTIFSTIDGVVMDRTLHPGEYAGENTPVLKAAALDPLNVEVIVPLRLYNSIRKGSRAEVRPESPIGGSYTGTVVIVDKVVDAASATFGVRVQVPNPDMKLPAGVKCKVRFIRK